MKRIPYHCGIAAILAVVAIAACMAAVLDKLRTAQASPAGATESREHQPKAAADLPRPPADPTPDVAGYKTMALPFLKRYCIKCHGPELQEADFRVDQHLANDFTSRSVAARWSEVLHRLHRQEMPPQGEEPVPTKDEAARIIEWIERQRVHGEQARRCTSIALRRLNRAEYNNTVRELTGIDMRPADAFPADAPGGGFDNNGSALSISPLQMELYVDAARKVLDRAIVTEATRPEAIKWRFEFEQGNIGQPDRRRQEIGGQRVFVNAGSNPIRGGMTVLQKDTGGLQFLQAWDFKVPAAGEYIVRLRAAGVVPPEESVREAGRRLHENAQLRREDKLATDEERQRSRESFKLDTMPHVRKHFELDRRYRYGPPRAKVLFDPGASRILGEFDVDAPESDPRIYEMRTWLEPVSQAVMIRNGYRIPTHTWNWWILLEDNDFPRPELLVDWLEIEGPIYDAWPPSSHRRILIDSPHKESNEVAYVREVLAAFMCKAYRRPLREGEVEAKLSLFTKVRPNCDSLAEAIKVPLVSILSSPHFLFLVEGDGCATPGERRSIDEFELASRLSYFLWSAPPDEELWHLAENKQLRNRDTLVAQAERLLADERSGQFVTNFAGQWLGLREVGANPPSPQIFPEYDDHLESSVRSESEVFFSHLLHNDLSVLNFIRSEFVTINERMARLYDIRGVKGDEFRAVPLPAGTPRGGLLTQPSMLTITSNGTRTSPVKRGVWILERLLGDSPPPPPPNAGDIPPGAPGIDQATVGQRLKAHREQAQCAHCHRKIDPWGIALENFDGAGQWREREARSGEPEARPHDPRIDASSELPDGTRLAGVDGVQQALLDREDQFLRCLARKMYAYALGRELGYADEPLVTRAAMHMQQNGRTLRSLIHYIVTSDEFLTK